ncbi:MAG: DUF3105 domain-containing protein [Polyangiaceae bacterium]|nr:DUF3105 domain-containing protein [Polyangiaceae bacterium]
MKQAVTTLGRGCALALGLSACGGELDAATPVSDEPLPAGCQATARAHPSEGQAHVDACTKVTYGTNPPSSGSHYPVWAASKAYDAPIPQGFIVHALEHGAVAVQYRPADVDAATRAALSAWVSTLPLDPTCGDARRVLIAPNPDLDAPFAAAAWQTTLTSTCFHGPTFARFYRDHVGRAPEDICAGGSDVSNAAPGCGK